MPSRIRFLSLTALSVAALSLAACNAASSSGAPASAEPSAAASAPAASAAASMSPAASASASAASAGAATGDLEALVPETVGDVTMSATETDGEIIKLRGARNCLYWSSDVRGFVGLAESGPTTGCRVGPAAPKMTLFDVTSVIECTPEAVERWESAPWG